MKIKDYMNQNDVDMVTAYFSAIWKMPTLIKALIMHPLGEANICKEIDFEEYVKLPCVSLPDEIINSESSIKIFTYMKDKYNMKYQEAYEYLILFSLPRDSGVQVWQEACKLCLALPDIEKILEDKNMDRIIALTIYNFTRFKEL